MKNILLITLLSLLAFSSNLFASGAGDLSAIPEMESDGDRGWSGMLGLAVLSTPEYVGGDESEGAGLPLILVDYNDRVYFKINTLGVWLWKPNDTFRVGLAAKPRQGIDAEDVPVTAGGGLSEDRDSQVEAGINFRLNLDKFSLEAFFLTASDESEGSSALLKAHYTHRMNDKWAIIGGLHVEKLDEDIVDYYYRPDGAALGVSGAEDATNTSLLLMATYSINKEWVALGGFKATSLDDIIKDSTVAEDDAYNVIFAGAAWKF